MLSCSIWFSAPSFWMGGGPESRCVSCVYGADGAVRHTSIKIPYCIKLTFHIISWYSDVCMLDSDCYRCCGTYSDTKCS